MKQINTLQDLADYINSERSRIAQRIAELRKEQGMSQAELADKSGMLRPHIARVESGRYGITLDVLARIAAALGVKVDLIKDKEQEG